MTESPHGEELQPYWGDRELRKLAFDAVAVLLEARTGQVGSALLVDEPTSHNKPFGMT